MIIFRSTRIFFGLCRCISLWDAECRKPLGIFFSGQLDYIQYNTGGVYSSVSEDTLFIGSINDGASGFISDGNTYTSFGCSIAAGGLSVSNDVALTSEDANFSERSSWFCAIFRGRYRR